MQVVRVGVLADTHIPHRLDRLPGAVSSIFAGVDLILHAGDLDEADVVAELSRIAPTVAVRGNWHLNPPNRSSPHLPATIHLYTGCGVWDTACSSDFTPACWANTRGLMG
jgi:hypothetical protein